MAKVITGARGKILKDGETIGYVQSVSVAGDVERVIKFEDVRLVKGYEMKDLCGTKLQVLDKNDVKNVLEEVEVERIYEHGFVNLMTGHRQITYSNKENLDE